MGTEGSRQPGVRRKDGMKQGLAVLPRNVQGREAPPPGSPTGKALTMVGQVRIMRQVSPAFTPSSFSLLLINVRMLSFWAFDRNWSIFVTGKK